MFKLPSSSLFHCSPSALAVCGESCVCQNPVCSSKAWQRCMRALFGMQGLFTMLRRSREKANFLVEESG